MPVLLARVRSLVLSAGARLPTLIEKSVELGAGEIVPVVTSHCHARTLNEARLLSIATEAAEQCGRLDVPTIRPMQTLPQVSGCGGPRN